MGNYYFFWVVCGFGSVDECVVVVWFLCGYVSFEGIIVYCIVEF